MKILTLKDVLKERHTTYLNSITEMVLGHTQYGVDQLNAQKGVVAASEIRRKIVFIQN